MVWMSAFHWFMAGVCSMLTFGAYLANGTNSVLRGLTLVNPAAGCLVLRQAIRKGLATNI